MNRKRIVKLEEIQEWKYLDKRQHKKYRGQYKYKEDDIKPNVRGII